MAGLTADYDMRDYFNVGDSVFCSREKSSHRSAEYGSVLAVTKYIVVVQFQYSKETYTYHDYALGHCKVK